MSTIDPIHADEEAIERREIGGIPTCSLDVVDGRMFRSAQSCFPWSAGPRLVVGDDGVSVIPPRQPAITVLFRSCAAALSLPTGAVQIIGEDGFSIDVQPGHWRGGNAAVRALIDAIPPEQLVRIFPEGEAGPVSP